MAREDKYMNVFLFSCKDVFFSCWLHGLLSQASWGVKQSTVLLLSWKDKESRELGTFGWSYVVFK